MSRNLGLIVLLLAAALTIVGIIVVLPDGDGSKGKTSSSPGVRKAVLGYLTFQGVKKVFQGVYDSLTDQTRQNSEAEVYAFMARLNSLERDPDGPYKPEGDRLNALKDLGLFPPRGMNPDRPPDDFLHTKYDYKNNNKKLWDDLADYSAKHNIKPPLTPGSLLQEVEKASSDKRVIAWAEEQGPIILPNGDTLIDHKRAAFVRDRGREPTDNEVSALVRNTPSTNGTTGVRMYILKPGEVGERNERGQFVIEQNGVIQANLGEFSHLDEIAKRNANGQMKVTSAGAQIISVISYKSVETGQDTRRYQTIDPNELKEALRSAPGTRVTLKLHKEVTPTLNTPTKEMGGIQEYEALQLPIAKCTGGKLFNSVPVIEVWRAGRDHRNKRRPAR